MRGIARRLDDEAAAASITRAKAANSGGGGLAGEVIDMVLIRV